MDNIESENLRKEILGNKVRPDGRGMTDIALSAAKSGSFLALTVLLSFPEARLKPWL